MKSALQHVQLDRLSYESHQLAHGALDMENIGTLDADHTALHAKGRQKDIGTVVLNDLAHLVKTLKNYGIELGVGDHDGLHKDLCRHDQVMQTLLGT